MSETQVGQDPEVTAAIERLMSMELSSFEEMVDTVIKARIGVMRELTSDGYTIFEALIGKSIHQRPVLLTESEIQSIRFRGRYDFLPDAKLRANMTIRIVNASLKRIGISDDLRILRIKVTTRRDKDRRWHIVFAPVTSR